MPRLFWIGSPFFSGSLAGCGWDEVARHNFEDPVAFGWNDIVRLAGFVPDVVVVADKSRAPFVLGMEDFPCLTVFYSVDSHIHSWHSFYAQAFDACLVSLRDHLPRFPGKFLPSERVWWSPPFAWDDDAPQPGAQKETDCLFVGSVNADLPRRKAFLAELGRRFPGLRVTRGSYRRLYPHARVLLNHCEHGDLNFRVFEALGCGGCLVTPRIGHGLADIFTEGEHLRCYAPDTVDAAGRPAPGPAARDALAQIRYLLNRPEEARRMAQAGLALVDAGHRARHRARAFTRRMLELLPEADALTARRRSRAKTIRESSLRLLYLHSAETSSNAQWRQALLAAANGDIATRKEGL